MLPRIIYGIVAIIAVVIAVALLSKYVGPMPQPSGAVGGPAGNGQVVCTMEAKRCPDGAFVGRSGPKCEFAACPTRGTLNVEPKSDAFTVALNGKGGPGIDLTPLSVLEDSRCPTGVQCIWAGTVRVHATVGAGSQITSKDFTLNVAVPVSTSSGTANVTFVGVTPAPKAGVKIAPSDYRFSFKVVTK